jgi:hypothetical protein
MDPSASSGFVDLEGYIAARILTLALEKSKDHQLAKRSSMRWKDWVNLISASENRFI